ncbi:MAG: plasmid recombination protein [Clostridiales Family XIII bacterium]|nr:plasmid recombination protein [Clostridiales Family XIII bacterium]
MIGKGSVNHNSRIFHAQNTDPERSHLNRCYVSEPIREVYHDLFDEAVIRYNEKQTRADRVIDDYYEKIRTGKQEKLFHEVIFQVGNKDDMGVGSPDGETSVKILDKFARGFQERNPHLRLFSAHLHLDEATPHLHLDFIPFTTGSKRGLDTRVSLKQALAAQGFKGGTRQETEWSQWVLSEKKELAKIMERHGVEWEQLGTTDKHLSVLNYEKEQRAKEVAALETKIGSQEQTLNQLSERKKEVESEIEAANKKCEKITARLEKIEQRENLINLNVRRYDDDPEWQLPEPSALMSAKSYKTKIADPFIAKLKNAVRSIVKQYLDLKSSVSDLRRALFTAQERVETLTDRLMEAKEENTKLREVARDFGRVKKAIGAEKTESILMKAHEQEQAEKQIKRKRNDRER